MLVTIVVQTPVATAGLLVLPVHVILDIVAMDTPVTISMNAIPHIHAIPMPRVLNELYPR